MKKIIDYDSSRFRSWTLILYPDSESYDFNSVFQVIKSYKDYAYIKHDPDDDIKKVHYHVNLFLDNNTTRSALSKKLGLPENYIECISNIRVMNRYLTHIDYPERKLYDLSLCVVSSHYWKRFKRCYDDLETEHDILLKLRFHLKELVSLYDNRGDIMFELALWASDNCYEYVYKKYKYELLDILNYML